MKIKTHLENILNKIKSLFKKKKKRGRPPKTRAF